VTQSEAVLARAPRADDPIRNEWFPVATASDVTPGSRHPFDLLGDRYVLVKGNAGRTLVVSDTCPHRGAQLSLGRYDGERIACPYHGWEYDGTGRCVLQPAQPTLDPPRVADLTPIPVTEAYGLYWVCLGSQPRELPIYPEYGENPGRTVFLGPNRLGSSGPRIIENFLDMAHFPYVHATYLGEVPHTEVRPYDVRVVDGELQATNCVFWQPRPGPTATEGGDVQYLYRVSHPYAAMLSKLPAEADGGQKGGFSLLLVASPEHELSNRVWMLTTIWDEDNDFESFNDFNKIIFGQDIPIVESQRPARLPLDPHAERHQPSDRTALAYRRWLVDRGIRYGTSRNDDAHDTPGGPE
jgi:phenylpropionate dioxygenase-like ring-hydroxylating dioxygenase large terminal subunit